MSRALWTRHWKLTWVALVVTALVGCGEGYRLDPATFNVNDVTDESRTKLLVTVSRSLKAEGFEDFGRYDEMIALIRQNRAMSPAARDEELARLNRERTFLNDSHHLRVVWADYSNGLPTEPFRLGYKPTSDHFVELNVYEERPGGFRATRSSKRTSESSRIVRHGEIFAQGNCQWHSLVTVQPREAMAVKEMRPAVETRPALLSLPVPTNGSTSLFRCGYDSVRQPWRLFA